MHHFHYVDKELYCEDVPVKEVAKEFGTPLYLYSYTTLQKHFTAFDDAFHDVKHLTCFSMKSNSNLSILRIFAKEGGGVDIISGGELFRALKAGFAPEVIVYSGVGKEVEDLEYAVQSDILMFNVESTQEIYKLEKVAGNMGRQARIAIRVNPDVDSKTHPYVSTGLKENKFGIDIGDAPEAFGLAKKMEHLSVSGISCHIGSQLTEVGPFVDSLKRLMELGRTLEPYGIEIEYLNLGGGLGITYDEEQPPRPEEYARAIKDELGRTELTLILEPGRVITGNAGILVTEVLYTKAMGEKNFLIVDAAMNDLMRPTLYGSYHGIQPIMIKDRQKIKADIVGPICESGDFIARDRDVEAYEPGELMAIMSAGAYGFSMSSNYNSRPRACEAMVKGDRFYAIRSRETFEDLIRGEVIPDFLMDQ